ncbi:MAG: hypothetical protein R3D67_19120 [Hyphomicrobiaceae bacterium]
MPPLIAAALIGAGLYVGARVIREIASLVASDKPVHPAAADSKVATRDLGHLELDPTTGVYRPKQD